MRPIHQLLEERKLNHKLEHAEFMKKHFENTAKQRGVSLDELTCLVGEIDSYATAAREIEQCKSALIALRKEISITIALQASD